MEEDRLKSIILIFLIIIIIGLIYFAYYDAQNFYNEKLDNVCIDNGYNEITDYKKVNTREIWYNSEYELTFKVECDNKVLTKQYNIYINIENYCVKNDKWGNCEYSKHETKYSKPYENTGFNFN